MLEFDVSNLKFNFGAYGSLISDVTPRRLDYVDINVYRNKPTTTKFQIEQQFVFVYQYINNKKNILE